MQTLGIWPLVDEFYSLPLCQRECLSVAGQALKGVIDPEAECQIFTLVSFKAAVCEEQSLFDSHLCFCDRPCAVCYFLRGCSGKRPSLCV